MTWDTLTQYLLLSARWWYADGLLSSCFVQFSDILLLLCQEVAQQSVVTRLRKFFESKVAKEREIKYLDEHRQFLRSERDRRGERGDYDRQLNATTEKIMEVIEDVKVVSEQIERLQVEYHQLEDEKHCK